MKNSMGIIYILHYLSFLIYNIAVFPWRLELILLHTHTQRYVGKQQNLKEEEKASGNETNENN